MDYNPDKHPASEEVHTVKDKVHTEEFVVSGEALVSKVKELVREGNIRRIIIKNEEGRSLIEIPLTIGVVGAIALPVLSAVGAMAALIANCTIAVERRGEKHDKTVDVPPHDPSHNKA